MDKPFRGLLLFLSYALERLPWWLRWWRICLQCKRPRFDSWRREWLPTPVFLAGESHEQRSLAGYSPWDHKESDVTEWLSHSPFFLFLERWAGWVTSKWKHGEKEKKQWKVKAKVAHLCPTLCDPMDYTVHGILQARILEWVAFPFSRGSSQPRDQTQVSHIAGGFFTSWATREAQEYWSG